VRPSPHVTSFERMQLASTHRRTRCFTVTL
jgi:hypothetical protein